VSRHLERFIDIHTTFVGEDYRPTPHDVLLMTASSRNAGAYGLHFGAFLPTILSRAYCELVAALR
jgi:hypothetical protein